MSYKQFQLNVRKFRQFLAVHTWSFIHLLGYSGASPQQKETWK